MRGVWPLTLLLIPLRLAAADAGPAIAYAAVDGVVAFHRLASDQNLYPWERAEATRQDHAARKNGATAVLVSNAGGFADFTYYLYRPGTTVHPQQWHARGLLGEWGRVGEFMLETPHLVKYRRWRGTDYILKSVPIHVDGAHQPFIADRAFIADQHWSQRLQRIRGPGQGAACGPAGDSPEGHEIERRLREEGPTATIGGRVCLVEGVYLRDLDAQVLANRRNDRGR